MNHPSDASLSARAFVAAAEGYDPDNPPVRHSDKSPPGTYRYNLLHIPGHPLLPPFKLSFDATNPSQSKHYAHRIALCLNVTLTLYDCHSNEATIIRPLPDLAG